MRRWERQAVYVMLAGQVPPTARLSRAVFVPLFTRWCRTQLRLRLTPEHPRKALAMAFLGGLPCDYGDCIGTTAGFFRIWVNTRVACRLEGGVLRLPEDREAW